MEMTDHERRLISVLDRQVACDSLAALISAIKTEPINIDLAATAIGLDANVFLKLTSHPKSLDIVDYLSSRHSSPLILPGQAIQEFWNNQLHAVDTVAATLKKNFDALKRTLASVDKNFGDYSTEIDALLEQFSAEHGHIYDSGTIRKTLALLETLASRATVPYASRTKYQDIAHSRKSTKTPPGFKDEGDGDFFIWVDLLLGLQSAQTEKKAFARVVLVTEDKKIDWSRAGVAHPILVAEVKALFDVPFEVWTIDQLASEIAKVT